MGARMNAKRKPGRPPFEPTAEQRELVKQLAGLGTRHEDIARLIKIDEGTMRKHFGDELEAGRAEANAKVAHSLFKAALAGVPAAMIFWLKTRAGWREVHAVEHTGKDGEPLPTAPAAQVVIYLPQKDELPMIVPESAAPARVERDGPLPAIGHADVVQPSTNLRARADSAVGRWSDGSAFFPAAADPRPTVKQRRR